MSNWINNEEAAIVEEGNSKSIVMSDTMLLRLPSSTGYIPSVDNDLAILVLRDKQELDGKYKENRYFKLFNDHKSIGMSDLNENHMFKKVESNEHGEVVEFINSCYVHIRVSEAEVANWTKRDVYGEDLWIWVIDRNSNEKLALGIAELDNEIKEGALEWIQVKKL